MNELISRSAENEADRRRFLRGASMAGLGVVGAGLLGSAAAPALAQAAKRAADAAADGDDSVISDGAILNFALNLE